MSDAASTRRLGVVVPARNEELLIGACLDAIDVARSRVAVPVHVVVVLDRCTDATWSVVASRPWAQVVEIGAGNVGAARAAGAAAVLRWAGDTPLRDLWLATTDADSTVPANWLTRQLELADLGWEVVVGTVAVADWSEHPPTTGPLWARGYHAVEHHSHVHGANLGFTAAAYVDGGGWPAMPADEDVALVAALAHRRMIRTATLPVVTSSRRDPRATGGFGDTLRDLAG